MMMIIIIIHYYSILLFLYNIHFYALATDIYIYIYVSSKVNKSRLKAVVRHNVVRVIHDTAIALSTLLPL